MRLFDHIDPGKLDQRDAELWVLAIAMLVVLAAGLAALMYPAAFSGPVTVSSVSARGIFFGFCTLCLLLVGYLLERQVMVRQLRRQLEEERKRSANLLNQASEQLLESLPGYEPFRQRLALEFSRAVNFQQPLSLLVARLRAARQAVDAGEASMVYVDAVKAMIRKLRGEDSIYLLAPGAFGIVLPGVFSDGAERVAKRLSEGLTDASGAAGRFSFEMRIVNYPQTAATAPEMEQLANAYFAEAGQETAPSFRS